MELTVSREKLVRELNLLSGIVERRTTIPILSHFLLECRDGELHLVATDLDVSLSTFCPAEIQRSGGIAVGAKKFFEIVRALPDEEISLEEEEPHSLTIRGARSRFRIRGLDPENFPTLPQVDPVSELKLSLKILQKMISKIFFAISTDDSRFQLGGALLKLKNGGLEMVATDGYRLSLMECSREDIEETEGVLIPRKALQEIARFEGEEDVIYRRGEHHLSFQFGDRELTCRILEGTFPDYTSVIASDNNRIVAIDRKALQSSIGRVALLTGDRGRAVRLTFSPDQLVISVANPDLGDAMEQVTCQYDGPEFHIGLNPYYVTQFLSVLDKDEAILELKDSDSQCVGRPQKEEEGERFRSVIMPMRV